MKKLNLKTATSLLSRREMKMINGGGYNIGPDCKNSWGQPCGSGTPCIGSWQCAGDPNKSQCYQGYCNHIG